MSDVEEPVEEELDPFDEEIAALGPPPGMGSGFLEQEYYDKVAEINGRRAEAQAEEVAALQEEQAAANDERSEQLGRRDIQRDRLDQNAGDDGTGSAPGT